MGAGLRRGCFLTSSLIGTLALSLTIPLSILADIFMQKVRLATSRPKIGAVDNSEPRLLSCRSWKRAVGTFRKPTVWGSFLAFWPSLRFDSIFNICTKRDRVWHAFSFHSEEKVQAKLFFVFFPTHFFQSDDLQFWYFVVGLQSLYFSVHNFLSSLCYSCRRSYKSRLIASRNFLIFLFILSWYFYFRPHGFCEI